MKIYELKPEVEYLIAERKGVICCIKSNVLMIRENNSFNWQKYDNLFNSLLEYDFILFDKSYIDWSKIAIDTKIYVSNSDDINAKYKKRYFAGYKDGKILAYAQGQTSWSSESAPSIWLYAKLC